MKEAGLAVSVREIKPAVRGWLALQRARLAHKRHPDLGEISAYSFYATRLRFRDLAFDIGANAGEHTAQMLNRGARVIAVEPQASLAAQLAKRFPAATVLPIAVGDKPGTAMLHHAREGDHVASLDPSWTANLPGPHTWEGTEQVNVTTLDDLIDKYGDPTVVKIDTEGFDHRVLRGLSRSIEHVLFEVNAALPHHAQEAFERLDALGHYEYYGATFNASGGCSWLFREAKPPDEILAGLVPMGDVYAHRVG